MILTGMCDQLKCCKCLRVELGLSRMMQFGQNPGLIIDV